MADSESIIAYILFFVGLLITLLVPLPIKEEYRLFIITAIILIFLMIILSKYNAQLEKQNKDIENLNKRFKTMEELNDIRLDIRQLKREVFKK